MHKTRQKINKYFKIETCIKILYTEQNMQKIYKKNNNNYNNNATGEL